MPVALRAAKEPLLFSSSNSFMDIFKLRFPLLRRTFQNIAVGHLHERICKAANIKGADIQLTVIALHPPDILIEVAAEAGAQIPFHLREQLVCFACHQIDVFVCIHPP